MPGATQLAFDSRAVGLGTGTLSLNVELLPVGSAYHFSKLHGQPRLVLQARHENVDRWALAIAWALLCLIVAVATMVGLKRAQTASTAYRGWPWVGVVVGIAWLFLLPAGVLGWALLVVSLCTWVIRSRRTTRATAEAREAV